MADAESNTAAARLGNGQQVGNKTVTGAMPSPGQFAVSLAFFDDVCCPTTANTRRLPVQQPRKGQQP